MNFINKIELDSSIWGCPDGAHMLAVAALAKTKGQILYVARDDARLALMRDALARLAPSLDILVFPAWDCLPYDRLSPQGALVGQRIETLARLASKQATLTAHTIVLTTVNAFLQRVPPQSYFAESSLHITVGQTIEPAALATFLANNAYLRTDTVRETGEFAVRGGIVDVFPPGHANPVRLDFFGDEIETMRSFDPSNQRSIGKADRLALHPVAEFRLNSQTVERFRTSYLATFGASASRDALYASVSAERTHPGIEHWLPLFHAEMVRLTDYCPDWPIILDHEAQAACVARFEQIADFYAARADREDDDSSPYRPLARAALYLGADELEEFSAQQNVCNLQRFAAPDDSRQYQDAGGRPGLTFTTALARGQSAVVEIVEAMQAEMNGQRRPIVIAAASEGAAVRLDELIGEQMGAGHVTRIDSLNAAKPGGIHIIIWSLDAGFQSDQLLVIAEADIFGQRLSRPQSKRGKGDDFLREVSALATGDLVVHAEHGIGRYDGLVTINSAGGDHDCLHLVYHGGDKLYLPVENIELLSRYGSGGSGNGSGGDSGAQLDRLGGAAWQARLSRIKGRIKIMAEQLIKIAAQRHTAKAEPLLATDGLFAEFCDRFSFVETDDQLNAIQDVIDDLASGKASDRLICGDVGFGKTEVALRAAFIVAMAGYQVALVAPTTLLARQHGKQFDERFAGFPLKLGVLSRMTATSDAKQIKEGLASGDVQVVIGTHALLAKSLSFNNLGLLIVDEEQHFGVGQKERLKEMRGDIHVLTLSATPIPRTLQMALSGVRDMSLIATPPVDRLAVRTFVGPWDGVVLREAILREMFRGGQIFVVCPRIDDLQRVYDRLRKLVPDARILSAHGRVPAAKLDDVMTKFADGEADILLSTNIVESGIDIPSANTMIIHRADMFGLSQLYQLRGRVGRGRQRAYAYLTSDPNRILTPQARRRLEVMQTLDTLGAGFTLASYDMDIRGAGNLLGDEQSGHVREVGVELYQEMLRQAVDAAKSGDVKDGEDAVVEWTPQINLGLEVRIPEAYVPDLTVRLSLYRRIAGLSDMSEIDAILAELVDRFGAMPDSVRNLFAVIEIKQLCKLSNVEKIDAGPKGFSIGFRDNHFANPEQLVGWIAAQQGRVQLRGDHKLIIKQTLPQASGRAPVCKGIVQELVALM